MANNSNHDSFYHDVPHDDNFLHDSPHWHLTYMPYVDDIPHPDSPYANSLHSYFWDTISYVSSQNHVVQLNFINRAPAPPRLNFIASMSLHSSLLNCNRCTNCKEVSRSKACLLFKNIKLCNTRHLSSI